MSAALEQPSEVAPSSPRRWIFRVLQILVTLALIAWLAHQADWTSVGALFRNVQPVLILGACVSLLASHGINVLRWRYLLDRCDIRFANLLRIYTIGLFANNFLPTGIGGDGVRVALLRQRVALGRAMFSVVADRGIGLVAISAIMLVGLWAGLPPGFQEAEWQQLQSMNSDARLALFAAVVLLLLFAALLVWRLPQMRNWVIRRTAAWQLPEWSIGEWVGRMAVAYGISVGAHLCIVAATGLVLVALHINVPLAASIWLVVLSSLSLLVPVTVNGMGIVESVYVLVLSSYGVEPTIGLSAALIVRVVALLISLGGSIWMLDQRFGNLRSAVE